MDEPKLATALTYCMALARMSQPRVVPVADYLANLKADPSWTADEWTELQRRILVGLVEDDDEGQVI